MAQVQTSNVESRLQRLGHEVPSPPKPAANYVPWTRSGSTVYIAGQIPVLGGELQGVGHVGGDVDVPEAQRLAGICALNGIANLKAAAADSGRSLDDLRIVRASVFVAVAKGFTDVHLVANGASDLLGEVFGDNGRHARSAVGVAELPLGVPVEVELIAEFVEG